MALADIIKRIDGDSTGEAGAIVQAAQEQAEATLAAARERAERERSEALARAHSEATAEADTIRAAARLAARDRLVAAKGELVSGVLADAARAVVELPDAEYAELIARRVVAATRGGERLLIADADRARLESRLPAAIEKAAGRDLNLDFAKEPAGVEHGVVVLGERSMVDLSIAALVDGQRDRLSMIAADALFGEPASEE